MMDISASERARSIISGNVYMTLATSDARGQPWAATLYFAFDEMFRLYFVSGVRSKHVEHLLGNPIVALSIFDSHAPPGEGDGVQMAGIASAVTVGELPHVLRVYFTRRFLDPSDRERHVDPRKYIHGGVVWFYRVEPSSVFVLDLTATDVDRRIEVNLAAR